MNISYEIVQPLQQEDHKTRKNHKAKQQEKVAEDIVHYPKLLGESLRRLRLASDASLQELAAVVGVSKSFLSMVESGQRSLKFEATMRIMQHLAYPFGWFLTQTRDSFLQSVFDKPLEERTNAVVQDRSAALLMTGQRDNESEPRVLLLRPLRNRTDSEWLEIMLPPQSQLTENALSMRGEVRGVVQQGTLLLVLNNDEYRVKRGEEFCFDGNLPHLYRNYLGETVVFLLVVTPAAF